MNTEENDKQTDDIGLPHQPTQEETEAIGTTLAEEVGKETAQEITQGSSLYRDALRRLFLNRATLVSTVILAIIALLSFFGPIFLPSALDEIFWDSIGKAPTLEGFHIFGTDGNGRDLLTRVLHGGRISLSVALVATFVSMLIGVTYGAVSGFIGGRVDNLMMRFVDILYSLPFMFLVILMMVVFGRSIYLIFIAIGAVEWLSMARIVRGQTLSLKRKEFIDAARALGVRKKNVLRYHIIPNTIGTVIIYVTLTVPRVILIESFLSFLGLGVQEPMTSWGVLISEGAANMEQSPWMLAFPALFLTTTLFCLNFIGDGLRDALDPKSR